MGLFSGLEALGLGKLKDKDIFDDDKKAAEEAAKQAAKAAKEPVTVSEKDLILEKSIRCPVCDHTFKYKAIKTGKARLIGQDADLRPRYADVDALKYNTINCPDCGYGSLAKNFSLIGIPQSKLIKQEISQSFMGLGEEPEILSYEDAITRAKLALLCSVVKRGKVSERAYTCLILAWLHRGLREKKVSEGCTDTEVLGMLSDGENEFLIKAKEGFMEAFSKETFPLYSLDEMTSIYVIAALSAETGNPDEALRWISRIITSTNANERIKEKGRALKEMINNKEFG